jgi:hypothetical protein
MQLAGVDLQRSPKHTYILAHAERGFRRRVIPPIDPDGRVCVRYWAGSW